MLSTWVFRGQGAGLSLNFSSIYLKALGLGLGLRCSTEPSRDRQLQGLCLVYLWFHVSFFLPLLETDEPRCVWMERQKQDIVKQKRW